MKTILEASVEELYKILIGDWLETCKRVSKQLTLPPIDLSSFMFAESEVENIEK